MSTRSVAEIEAWLLTHLRERLGPDAEDIDAHLPFSYYGLDSLDAIAHMAGELTSAMLNERAPDDGHRKNILSSAFHHIGIAIFRDRHGTVWLTQDFSN